MPWKMRAGLPKIPLFTYEDWLLACFVLGVAAGTAVTLAFGDMTVLFAVVGAGNTRGRKEFMTVLGSRLSQLGLGWLGGLAVCSRLLFGLLTFYAGMCLAAVLSLLTMEKGLLGLPAFLLDVLPQGFLYILIWLILSRWAGQREKKMHLAGTMLLGALAAAGAYIEVTMPVWLSVFK